jgi:phage terminase large subunit GpA-like protein
LTAGVDVQRDRLEASIIGWGPGHESWIVEWRVLPGDPESPAVWQELDQLLLEEWPTEEGGRASVAMLAVDSGFATQAVYNWVRGKDPARVIAVRGRAGLRMILAPPRAVDVHRSGKSVKFRGAKVWEVGVDVVKGELYGWLRQQPPTDPQDPYPPGFVHFPAGLPDEYYQQLTAEHRVERRRKDNRTFYEWKKVRERNEALDTFVYGRAALYHLGAHRWTPERWQALGGMARVPAAPGGIQGAGRRRTRRGGGLFNRGDARGDD